MRLEEFSFSEAQKKSCCVRSLYQPRLLPDIPYLAKIPADFMSTRPIQYNVRKLLYGELKIAVKDTW